MARGGMRDVILADDGDPEGSGRAPEDGRGDRDAPTVGAGKDSSDARRHLGARRKRLAAAGVVLVVAVGALVQWQARAPVLKLSEQPEALDELMPTLGEVWRAPAGAENMDTISRDLFVAEVAIDGRPHVLTFETTTGAPRWTAPPPDPASDWRGCIAIGDPDNEVNRYVACRVVPTAPDPASATGTSLYVLDARTGDTVRRRPLADQDATFTDLGTDLLVADTTADRRLQVTREDPATGQVQWTFRSAQPLPPNTVMPTFEERGGHLVAEGTALVLLTLDGAPVWEWGAPPVNSFGDLGPVVELAVAADDRIAIAGNYPSEPSEAHGNVKTLDGQNVYALPGPVLTAEPDDGTADDLLLTVSLAGDAIIALGRETGDERWRARVGSIGQALVLDRRLVVNTGSAVLALDIGDGSTLWEAAGVTPTDGGLWTDGRLAVVAIRDGGDARMAALDITDGRVRWTVPAPDGVLFYIQTGGRLYLVQLRTLIALGSASPDSEGPG